MTPKSINMTVAEKVKALGSDAIVNKVVETLANAEVNRRADALGAAIKLSEDLVRELRKAKPDLISVNGEGQKTENFTPKAFEAKKKLEERIAKVDKTVETAVTTGDWSKLYELVKSGGNNAAPAASADDSEPNS